MQRTILIGDIGGTNCRLALVSLADSAGPPSSRHDVRVADYADPIGAIRAYLSGSAAHANIHYAALAVAGPVTSDHVRLTNSAWSFSQSALQAALGVQKLLVVNDLQALSRAVLDLKSHELQVVGGLAAPLVPGPAAIIAPGTGLGVGVAYDAPCRFVTPCEGGHAGFAPADDFDLDFIKMWRPELGRIINEHIVSGPGLARLYQTLARRAGESPEKLTGRMIVRRALAGEDQNCRGAVERFAMTLGAVCADIVLAQGAREVVLAGSVAASLAPVLDAGPFRACFDARGPGGDYMRLRPTRLAARDDLGLLGAHACLLDALGGLT